MLDFNLSTMEKSIFYLKTFLKDSVKYSKIHYVSFNQQDLWIFLSFFFFPSCNKKKLKLQNFSQKEKLNDLIALQVGVVGAENYRPNGTG